MTLIFQKMGFVGLSYFVRFKKTLFHGIRRFFFHLYFEVFDLLYLRKSLIDGVPWFRSNWKTTQAQVIQAISM